MSYQLSGTNDGLSAPFPLRISKFHLRILLFVVYRWDFISDFELSPFGFNI